MKIRYIKPLMKYLTELNPSDTFRLPRNHRIYMVCCVRDPRMRLPSGATSVPVVDLGDGSIDSFGNNIQVELVTLFAEVSLTDK